ncbi:hypothetical protein [Streptomyces sp. MS2.AVA.5]|uniref:Uncharacterized protein n=1 Tax=Streptomyces achmelvichensis TaxID=3134111 RepID=A0ACC6Q8Q5_9ACTN
MGELWARWGDAPRVVRWVVVGCLVAGSAGLVVGILGDFNGFWDDKAFSTNLVSSVIGLLFGVPLALLVLSYLTEAQAEDRELKQCRRYAEKTVETFLDNLMQGFKGTDPSAIASALDQWKIENTQAPQLLRGDAPVDFDVRRQRAGEVYACLEARNSAQHAALSKNTTDSLDWLAQIVQNWDRLDSDIRPRVELLGIRWLPAKVYADLAAGVRLLRDLDRKHYTLLEIRAAFMFKPPSNPEQEEWTKFGSLLLKEAEAQKSVAKALLAIVNNIGAIKDIGK